MTFPYISQPVKDVVANTFKEATGGSLVPVADNKNEVRKSRIALPTHPLAPSLL